MKELRIIDGVLWLAVSAFAIGGCPAGDDEGDDGADTTGTPGTDPSSSSSATSPSTSASTTATSTTASSTDASSSDDGGSTSEGSTGPLDGSSGSESSTGAPAVTASANLEPRSDSTAMGTATFTVGGDGSVSLVVDLTGVAPADAAHGLHIHEVGDCSAPDGTSTGDHWNPKGTTLGELGTVDIDGGGAGVFNKTDAWSVGTGEVNDVVGRSIIIHADPDGGTRIACGVIELD
ncbi:MAG: superoxide dismutase family protein [Deltaproteobacteria bacterium]|nr:superoxide dismutase family protein [Nannocystaceae bacterium]